MNNFIIGLVCGALFLCTALACAAVPRQDAIYAIIGEAEGEGARGMLAVACAIRNRGTLKGVYGLHANRVINREFSEITLQTATHAWDLSSDSDNCKFIDGATHWEGTKFKTPYWAKGMQVTATIGNQRFYK